MGLEERAVHLGEIYHVCGSGEREREGRAQMGVGGLVQRKGTDKRDPVEGMHTLTSSQTQTTNLCAFIFLGTLIKSGAVWVAGSCVPWEQLKGLKVCPPEKRRRWGPQVLHKERD